MWNFYVANLAHALFTFLLLFKELAFTGNVTTVTFCGYVLTNSFHGFTGYNFSTNSSLNGNIELLARNKFFQFFADPATKIISIILMD